jgi:hypothetical protein
MESQIGEGIIRHVSMCLREMFWDRNLIDLGPLLFRYVTHSGLVVVTEVSGILSVPFSRVKQCEKEL